MLNMHGVTFKYTASSYLELVEGHTTAVKSTWGTRAGKVGRIWCQAALEGPQPQRSRQGSPWLPSAVRSIKEILGHRLSGQPLGQGARIPPYGQSRRRRGTGTVCSHPLPDE